MGDYSAWVVEEFCVVVMLSNNGDDLAQLATDAIPLYRETLRRALVNWHPLPGSRTTKPVEELADALFIFEGSARTCWKFDFQLRYQITTADCYMPPTTKLIRTSIINTNQ